MPQRRRHNKEAMRYRILFAALFLTFAAFPCFAQSLAPQCASLTSLSGLPNPTTVINASTLNAARAAQGNAPALPEHCEVQGRMNERTGVNAQRYAIRFHLRLPTDWNGRFFFEGGGGSNGNLGNAFGNLQGQQRGNALGMGFAVVSTDSGHDNAVNSDPNRNGTLTFGFDPQARRDFGYNSYDQVTQAAKAIIRAYYGRAPERSYYVGCSEGGREAMLMSQRFPTYFDGILACSPGFKLAKAALFGHAADVQALREVAAASGIFDRFGQPLLNKTFTDEDLDLASQAILAACDSLDGLADGIVDNFPACTAGVVAPKLTAITCQRSCKRNTCLLGRAGGGAGSGKSSPGPRNSNGGNCSMPTGPGIAVSAARSVTTTAKAGDRGNQRMFDAPNKSSIIATLGSASASALFVTPPVAVPASGAGPLAYLLGVGLPRSANAAKCQHGKSGEFTEAVLADFTVMASSTELSSIQEPRRQTTGVVARCCS